MLVEGIIFVGIREGGGAGFGMGGGCNCGQSGGMARRGRGRGNGKGEVCGKVVGKENRGITPLAV